MSQREFNHVIRVIDAWCDERHMLILHYDSICAEIGIDDMWERNIIDMKKLVMAKLKYGF